MMGLQFKCRRNYGARMLKKQQAIVGRIRTEIKIDPWKSSVF